ncbi:ParM/StbA family protein [Paenibacillus anaericanus]|uniref:ParM/StbA family protein n=1 Tax=Paenibacillus anaericanus TaxID=170367 RepID=A0A433YFF4_9BACL|nr:ParM/StbA family protein [Paenibacillus anaericanus]RUT48581.1 ParM/StbA family protein [Paenibacillus anaericanus]
MAIVAIDAGGDSTKIYDGQKVNCFPSAIGYDWRERNLKQQQGEHDFEWEYRGQKGFAGTLALSESECAESRKGDSKAHPDALLRILIALHQYTDGIEQKIVVGQPIKTHTPEEKQLIKEMVIGRHELVINGKRRSLLITRCEVAAEGVTAGLLMPSSNTIRIIDIGSGTVNFGTLLDRKFNDKGSFTLTTGMETLRFADPVAFGRQIAIRALASGWGKHDTVYLCGGGTEALQETIRAYFPNSKPIIGDPVTANVRAFFLIARKLYG